MIDRRMSWHNLSRVSIDTCLLIVKICHIITAFDPKTDPWGWELSWSVCSWTWWFFEWVPSLNVFPEKNSGKETEIFQLYSIIDTNRTKWQRSVKDTEAKDDLSVFETTDRKTDEAFRSVKDGLIDNGFLGKSTFSAVFLECQGTGGRREGRTDKPIIQPLTGEGLSWSLLSGLEGWQEERRPLVEEDEDFSGDSNHFDRTWSKKGGRVLW